MSLELVTTDWIQITVLYCPIPRCLFPWSAAVEYQSKISRKQKSRNQGLQTVPRTRFVQIGNRMHTCTPVLPFDSAPETQFSAVQSVIRSLLSLLGPAGDAAINTAAASGPAEQVLLDTEVDGTRYLVIRMPRPYSRIQLSPREQEIVRMVAQGHPNKVIADVLNISAWTVCTHLRRIFAKLGVGSRAAMIAQLHDLGIIRKDCPPLPHAR
jgi:DNA-binding CsgD family transcriptional regulator